MAEDEGIVFREVQKDQAFLAFLAVMAFLEVMVIWAIILSCFKATFQDHFS